MRLIVGLLRDTLPPGTVCRSWIIFALLALLGVSIAAPAWARKRARPMPIEEVSQTWIGISSDEQYMLRLALSGDGTGTGGYVFLDDEPRTFTIPEWHYDSGKLDIDAITSPGQPSWVRPLKGAIAGVTMTLEARGDDWKVEFWLRREAELQERWGGLRAKMAEQQPDP